MSIEQRDFYEGFMEFLDLMTDDFNQDRIRTMRQAVEDVREGKHTGIGFDEKLLLLSVEAYLLRKMRGGK